MSLPPLPPPHSRGFDVVACGENSLDFVAVLAGGAAVSGKRPLASFALHPGGQVATAASCCARLGLRTRYVGVFGDDEWGRRASAALAASGVEVAATSRIGAAGRIAVVVVDETGDRTVLEYRHPDLQVAPADLPADLITSGRILLVDATSLAASIHAARLARESGMGVMVDADTVLPRLGELLGLIDIIIVPEPFLQAWTHRTDVGDALRALAAEFPQAAAIVATLGPLGSIALAAGELVRTPGYRVDVVDTTGAGDAFRAGFAAAWATAGDDARLADVLAFANATAALNCRAVGAQTALPTRAEVRRLVTSGPHALSK